MPKRSRPLNRELQEFWLRARQPAFQWDGSRYQIIGSLLGQNFCHARLIHREEAAELISGKLKSRPNRYYRPAGPSTGVWVACWTD